MRIFLIFKSVKKNSECVYLNLTLSWQRESSPEDYWQFFVRRLKSSVAIGGSSNDDGDVNGNGKKAIDLVWQNNNFARASHYFVHFFAVTA